MHCVQCDVEFFPKRWGTYYCSVECRRKHGAAKMEEWRKVDRKADPEKYAERNRAAGLKRNYKMTVEDYEALASEQDGCCPVCGGLLPAVEEENGKHPPVDHDHETGKPRGVLHNKCNRAIGLLNDSPELCRKAAKYLESHGS